MSANKPRRAGAPAFPKRGPRLRLVKNPDERPRPEPDPELRVMLDDMKSRHSAQRDPGGKDAA